MTNSHSEGLFAGLFARGRVAAEISDRALLRAMLDFELALMRGLAQAGLAPARAVEGLELATSSADTFDLVELGRSAGEKGTPVPGLLAALRERLSPEDAAYLHLGATSQDVVDTALMLVLRRAGIPLSEDLRAAADACARLAEEHRSTLAVGRTLLQHAGPLPFGLKAAGWLSALDEVRAELDSLPERVLAVQLGGAVGTLAALGDRGLDVVASVAHELDLAEPRLPWHTVRVRSARIAGSLAIALGVMGKIGRDIVLLAQTEVAEAAETGEPGHGGSSAMPHKRNPIAAIAVIACAQRAPGLASTVLAAMSQEHERAAGAWQSEWEPLLELMRLAGSAAAVLREALEGLDLDPAAMRSHLDRSGALLMSESVAVALAGSVGRGRAQELVESAVRRSLTEDRPLREILLELPEVAGGIGEQGLDSALDPEHYLGVSGELIDRALREHPR